MTLRRRGAQDEAPRIGALPPSPAPLPLPMSRTDVTTAPPQAGSASAPSTLEPSRRCSVLTATVPATSPKDTVSPDMLSSTVVPSPRE